MTGLEYTLQQLHKRQSELADYLEVPRASVSTWVNGKVDIPEKHMDKIVGFTCIDPEFLRMKELTEIDKVRISREIALAQSKNDTVQYLDAQLSELMLLEEIRNYIETNGLTKKMLKRQYDAYHMNPKQVAIQKDNMRRVARFLDIAKSNKSEAVDTLLNSICMMMGRKSKEGE